MEYFCKVCHAEAKATDSGVERSCDCSAPIIATLAGEAHGHGGISA